MVLEIICVEPMYPQYSGVLETCLALRYCFFEVLGSENVKVICTHIFSNPPFFLDWNICQSIAIYIIRKTGPAPWHLSFSTDRNNFNKYGYSRRSSKDSSCLYMCQIIFKSTRIWTRSSWLRGWGYM